MFLSLVPGERRGMTKDLETLTRVLKDMRKVRYSGPGDTVLLRTVYLDALTLLCEDLMLRTLARQKDTMAQAIARAQERSEEELADGERSNDERHDPGVPDRAP